MTTFVLFFLFQILKWAASFKRGHIVRTHCTRLPCKRTVDGNSPCTQGRAIHIRCPATSYHISSPSFLWAASLQRNGRLASQIWNASTRSISIYLLIHVILMVYYLTNWMQLKQSFFGGDREKGNMSLIENHQRDNKTNAICLGGQYH